MKAELGRRLAVKRQERAADPAFQPMPSADWIVLAAIFAASLLAVVLI